MNTPSPASSVRRGPRACAALLALAFAPAACAPTLATARGDRAATEQVVQGPHAPAGTRITVRVRAGIDAPLGPATPRFEGDVVEPVRTAQGEVLVPAGAAVHGTIAWTGSSTRVALDDATIETLVGAVPLHAVVRGPAVRRALAGPERSPEDRDEALAARAPEAASPPSQVRSRVGESDAAGRIAAAPGARFVLAPGAEVRLVLTAPLLAPNASVLIVR